MPNSSPSMLKHPSAADVFLSRTKASDWDWAQQALAMGFSPFTALSKETSWALAAARHDQKHGARLALRLTQDLIDTLTTSTKRDAVDALSELGACITGAIEHGNLAFLTGLAPAFETLPDNARSKCAQFLGHRTPIVPSFGDLVWSELLALSRHKDHAKKDWAWTSDLPWPTTLLRIDGKLDDLWGVVEKARTQAKTHAQTSDTMLDDLVQTVGERVTTPVLDRAFNTVRRLPQGDWKDYHTEQMITVVNLLTRLPNTPSSVTVDGRDLFHEWQERIAAMPQDQQGPLRQAAQRWEVALLRKVADDNAATPEARSRSRL